MKVLALCHTCAHKHVIDFDPAIGPGAAFSDWLTKHPEHAIDFEWPGRTYTRDHNLGVMRGYLDNADVKAEYAASAAYSITLTSLGTSASWTAGRQSAVVSNTTNKYLDYLAGGKIRTGGVAPTDNTQIRIYLFGQINDTPTYPDQFSTIDDVRNVTDTELLGVAIPLFQFTMVDTSTEQDYWFAAKGIAASFNGHIPKNHGLWVTHNTGQNLDNAAADHVLNYTPVYATVI